MISRKGAKTQRKRNPIFRTSRPFDAAQDMLGVLAGETPKSESESPLSEKFAQTAKTVRHSSTKATKGSDFFDYHKLRAPFDVAQDTLRVLCGQICDSLPKLSSA
jgi:hypothetical protein